MGMLKPATNKMSFAKVGLYGTAGSGKTHTAARIAIGLHQFTKATKPVGFFDTEPAASYVIPLFEKAGVEFLVYDESRALRDLMAFMDEAEESCSVVIIDSITHVWREAQESYLAKVNEGRKRSNKKPLAALEFQHWRPIKAAWAEFTDRFLSSKVHAIVCGRAGQIYEYQDKDDGSGKKELISTGTRMATEKELGYEPSLLIEMIADRQDGKIVNVALIQKDRADKLNGQEIPMPDFEKLKPHFEALVVGGAHFESMNQRDSKEMFPDADEPGWDKEKQQRDIWCEEIQGLLVKHYPGATAIEKKAKADLLDKFFETRSWTKIESLRSTVIKAGFEKLRAHLEPPAGDPDAYPIALDALEKGDTALALDLCRSMPDEQAAEIRAKVDAVSEQQLDAVS